MAVYENQKPLGFVPTQESHLYPDTDGKPMAASDKHRLALTQLLSRLGAFFRQTPEVYVSGDLLMYYLQGDPRKVVSPDVLVAFGIGQKLRRTYLVWEEGKPPDFVMEFSSATTYERDLREKFRLYARLGIAEYFFADIERLYLPTPLMGFRLAAGGYAPVSPGSGGAGHSSVLDLDFHLHEERLHLYHPPTQQWIPTPEQAAEVRADQEALARQQETARVDQEARARQQETARAEAAEAEIAALRAELARRRGNPT